jgi:hypothetical protein
MGLPEGIFLHVGHRVETSVTGGALGDPWSGFSGSAEHDINKLLTVNRRYLCGLLPLPTIAIDLPSRWRSSLKFPENLGQPKTRRTACVVKREIGPAATLSTAGVTAGNNQLPNVMDARISRSTGQLRATYVTDRAEPPTSTINYASDKYPTAAMAEWPAE